MGGNLDIRDLAAGTTLYLPVEVEGGRRVDCVVPPARFDGADRTPGRVPAAGEHTDAIRTEFEEGS